MSLHSPADDYKTDVKPAPCVPQFSDSISSLSWASNHIFASTSWDGELRVFAIEQGQTGPAIFQKWSTRFDSPAMKCAWNDQNSQLYVGLSDGSIKLYDFGSSQTIKVGQHTKPISSLTYSVSLNGVISTAYEPNAYIWQPGNQQPVMAINAENKVFAADFKFPFLVAGTAKEKIVMMDVKNNQARVIVDSSDLGQYSQLQSLVISSKCATFGLGTVDGRANISSITHSTLGTLTNKSIITFKSNKREQAGNTILYPINSVDFNPINDRWFMTAGSDGAMHLWDYQAKNKIKTLSYGSPICTARVSPSGEMIAYGLGNDWHMGIDGVGKWPVRLGVHLITPNQTKTAK